MKEHHDWNDSYRDGNLPWDTGRPSSELQRVVSRIAMQPCRALELGCGTGTNCVWMAQQGFEVTGVDVAPLAVEQAKTRALDAGVEVHFVVGDVLHLPDLDGPFAFFFDRGCYHAVRRSAPEMYAPSVARQLVAGGRGLILAGNAREPQDPGPPVVAEQQLRDELGQVFQILEVRYRRLLRMQQASKQRTVRQRARFARLLLRSVQREVVTLPCLLLPVFFGLGAGFLGYNRAHEQ